MLILSVLTHRVCYGYEIIQTIKNLLDNIIEIKEGSLYPSLYKLQDLNYITSREEIVNRKIRVYYHIEDTGYQYLDEITSEYLLWENKINNILNYKGAISNE